MGKEGTEERTEEGTEEGKEEGTEEETEEGTEEGKEEGTEEGCVSKGRGCVVGLVRVGRNWPPAAAATGPKGRGPAGLLLPPLPAMYILLEGEADTDRRKEEEEEVVALLDWAAEQKREDGGGHAVLASPRKMADGSTMPELLAAPPSCCWVPGSMSR